ncbi:MDR family NADP-dependent oxidoreductase [Actinoallomurus rhizosphaericola]|uniref:MDR family NADP-dependent oxidoreductase n=1 Tax=Actinoallomurus rhizosphaericola TaxID=2952536 RepID=UPI0020929CBD|nr:NADP-dependent oxidoreductase [Actinoallomurus rhizosphaericola]MCO5999851.1 NADP-dependent oxidoreductase [Actinoallomurus rhizosphaericola]
MSELPPVSREVRLVTTPSGLPRPGDFAVAETPLRAPGGGEVVVHNRFFTVFSALRTLLGGGVEGAPFPPVRPGDALFGPAIGEVVSAPDAGGLHVGDLVSHWWGWRDYAVVDAADCSPLVGTLPDPVMHLSQGPTAYGALTRGARLQPGDTVFVSGGAGSVGSLAGPIARLLGAGRVIGSTGSPEKATRMVADLGYDAAVVRGAGPLLEQLAAAAPDGIDVLFDNVGGEDLRAAVATARTGARFVLVGALSGQLAADGTGTTAPVELDSYRLVLKQITMLGYSAVNDPDVRAEWIERFAGWARSGAIGFPYVRVDGLENAPRALHEMMTGRYLGTVVVAL